MLTIVTQRELGTTSDHSLLLNPMASFAEFEQEMTRERLADARAAHKHRGRRVAGVVPYGYESDPVTKQLAVEQSEAERVRKMFAWAAAGKTPREIAETANKKGWRTKKRTSKRGRVMGGGMWTPRQVLATLTNPAYTGLIHAGDNTRSGIHEAIVDQDTFDTVRKQVESRRTRSPGRSDPDIWPLRGLLYCGRCGRRMSPNTSGYRNVTYRYYRCRSTAGGKPPCEGVCVPAWEIEQFVVQTIDKLDYDAVAEEMGKSDLTHS